MANIKQQKKRVKQDVKRRSANFTFKSGLKSSIKRVETTVAENNKEAAVTALNIAYKKIDTAVTKGITHKNKAARQKSRLADLVNSL